MVICAAYGCSTRSGRDKVSLYSFPKDPGRRRKWTDRVAASWSASGSAFTLKVHSRLCSKHFTQDQFKPLGPDFAKEIGYGHKVFLRLNSDAVLSVFETVTVDGNSSLASEPSTEIFGDCNSSLASEASTEIFGDSMFEVTIVCNVYMRDPSMLVNVD